MRYAIKAFARISWFFLKYFDYLIIDRPAALDGASAVYFLGLKAARPISDRELLHS